MRRSGRRAGSRRQRGAAVLLALFVATLSTLIVSALFYRQFVLLRTIENQQLMTQSRLLLRGALDWGRAILREDANRSSYDALSEPWAQPLAETRLDQLGETSSLASLASIAGSMEDAQSRYNLRNLVENGQIVETEVEALRRLCALLQVAEQTADLIAQRMQEALPAAAVPDETGRMPDNAFSAEKVRPIPLMLPQDLIAVPGISARGSPATGALYRRSRRTHAGQREHGAARSDRGTGAWTLPFRCARPRRRA